MSNEIRSDNEEELQRQRRQVLIQTTNTHTCTDTHMHAREWPHMNALKRMQERMCARTQAPLKRLEGKASMVVSEQVHAEVRD